MNPGLSTAMRNEYEGIARDVAPVALCQTTYFWLAYEGASENTHAADT